MNKLNVIYPLYEKLNQNANNVLIGGSLALQLHGLNLDKKPEDIDLVIYKPTPHQEEILDLISLIVPNPTSRDKYTRRSYKINLGSITLDILVEKHVNIPENLLYYKYQDSIFIKIQSIEKVMEARRSYNELTLRKKDVVSSQKLKELNFNII